MARITKPLNVFMLAAIVCLSAGSAAAQLAPAQGRAGLAEMIPEQAIFYAERRGHEAIRPAYLASNLGKLGTDEAVNQFVNDSRVRIGRLIVKEMFDLEEDAEIAKHQQLLHNLLKPFWHKPAAVCVLLDDGFKNAPGLGFICVTGKYRQECKEALDALMKIGVPADGMAGERQAFTYRKGATVWRGVAKQHGEFKLPAPGPERDAALKESSVFMTCWISDILFIATKVSTADAMSGINSVVKPTKGKNTGKSFQAVMKKTAMKDWAFRWYVDLEKIYAAVKKEHKGKLPGPLGPLGLDKIRGIGGSGGYMDNVYSRLTYVYAPGTDRGILKLFAPKGDYKKAVAMAPDSATFVLAGQLNMKAAIAMAAELMRPTQPAARSYLRKEGIGEAAERVIVIESKAAEAAAEESEGAKVLKQFQRLTEASDGNLAIFMPSIADFRALMTMMMGGGGPPIAGVVGVKDQAQALDAVTKIAKLAGAEEQAAAPAAPGATQLAGAPVKPNLYRKVPIRYFGDTVRVAVMKDRLVAATSDDALKSAIDVALDKTGGFRAEGKAAALAKLAGDGSTVFKLDAAALAHIFWPILRQQVMMQPEDAPFASMPPAAKMVGLLGPEIVVFKSDAEGLLLKSRGKVPLITKILPGMFVGVSGIGFMF